MGAGHYVTHISIRPGGYTHWPWSLGSNPGSATCQLPQFPYLKSGYKQHPCGRTLWTLTEVIRGSGQGPHCQHIR